MRPDERETKIMTNNEKECGTLRSVRAVDGKLKCNLEWPKQYQLCMKDMTGRAPGLTCRSYRPHPEAWSERWVCNSV